MTTTIRTQFARFLVLPMVMGIVLSTSSAHAWTWPWEKKPAPTGATPKVSVSKRGWVTTKTSWSPSDERNFSEFVRALGESGCRTVDACLKGPANPYRSSDPQGVAFESDCADFPFYLRAYFAWKNGLPFGYVNAVEPVTIDGEVSKDIRYSRNGNLVVGRRILGGPSVKPVPAEQVVQGLNDMRNSISTAMLRFNPNTDGSTFFTDFYPVKIDRQSIRPGSLIYDPNGHAAVVYKVEDDGRVRFFDAHPDNSVTRGFYGQKFMRAVPAMGAGFKNWRPFKVEEANFVGATNATIADFGLEQFFGTIPSNENWKKGQFDIKGDKVDYYDYVRMKLAVGDLRYKPVDEVKGMLEGLCMDLNDRVMAVHEAVQQGLHKVRHPAEIPSNIYGTSGEWESYSTPSRDARLKTSFKELRDRTQEFLTLHAAQSPRIDYTGTNLAEDLLMVYENEAAACAVKYHRTDGSEVTLNLHQAMKRLFAMSFDPYHCPERRWGAAPGSEELSTCLDEREKEVWYEAEQRLRNQLERTYSIANPTTTDGLLAKGSGSGVDTPPDIDVHSMLKRAAGR